ncbi:MAG TPA: hypothetical protein VMV94_13860 [Phycisphaerae bacterium]|nr:hypothetical protein [Phycisphaerae bacterium]
MTRRGCLPAACVRLHRPADLLIYSSTVFYVIFVFIVVRFA